MSAPVKKFRIGYVSANVWKNEGTERDWYTVTLERTYKDDSDQLQSTNGLNHADLLNGAALLKQAQAWISAQ